jgi:hypothetical protein
MAFRPHSLDQYYLLFHHVWCLGLPMKLAAREANMNETVAFRAATGWAKGKDGAVGRNAFLKWMSGMRSPEGAPCCGGTMIPGKRKLPDISAEKLQQLATLRELEDAHEQVLKLKKELGLGIEPGPDSIDPLNSRS